MNAQELSAVVEASFLELYSSLDCTVKVLRAVYGGESRSFPDSTRKFFHNYEKVIGSFPDTLKKAFRGADWYDGLLYLRDELTHLATGSCTLDHKTGIVQYMHMGMKLRGGVYIIEDVFTWLTDTFNKVNGFLGTIFRVLNATLKPTPVQQVCGFVEGRILMRYLDPTEPLTFNSGQCFAYQWFERPENPTCPFVEHCGAYHRKMSPEAIAAVLGRHQLAATHGGAERSAPPPARSARPRP